MATRRPARLGLAFGVALLVVQVAAAHASAAGKDPRERAARKACLSGDYTKGVEILSDLFLDSRDATYIFNQGRCFEQNNRYEEAIARFREYLRMARDLTPESRADTEKHIAECQALVGPTSAPEVGLASAAPAAATPSPKPDVVAGAAPPVAAPGRGLRIGGLACGLVGLAAVGTGIYFYTRAKYYSDKVSGQDQWNPSDEDAGRRAETLQWVFYGTGAAALITGAALYWAGWPAADDGRTTTGLGPMVGPGLAGIAARGAF